MDVDIIEKKNIELEIWKYYIYFNFVCKVIDCYVVWVYVQIELIEFV